MSLTRRRLMKGAAALGSLWAMGCASTKTADRERPVAKKKILILGGTAFLGPALVERALSRGHTLTLFNRGKTRPGLFPQVEKLQGDRDGKLQALEGRKWDAVIDTSGYVPRVVKASAELLAPHVGHYLFVSSISVYEDTSKGGINEDSPLATVADETTEDVSQHYGALKALCEQAAERAMPGRVSNVRPGLIVGPDDPTDRFTYWPVRVAQGGEVLAPGDGEDPVQFIDVRDLAAFLVDLVENQDMGVFNATGPADTLPIRKLLETCKAANGGNATFTWAATPFLEAQKVSPWSDMPVWIPRASAELGMSRVSNARAQARGLGFRPLEETVRDTLTWFRTLPPERQAKLRSGLSSEREREVLAAWHQQAGAGGPPTARP
ncbi:SDR family oxidoreductase [Stigmatella sp. ncwal1]|uniref:SDR family oxidoreductase n=1 Tax=Stigmatella ashevillensis TaxID=2995309 RepID=A0ABT5DBW8_9BACT|nr:SDR family oxidoreductase [Stigmatella ashevillena]MDC0711175.1 SDR family oxidoreductase [Stigmatella ashevillena]